MKFGSDPISLERWKEIRAGSGMTDKERADYEAYSIRRGEVCSMYGLRGAAIVRARKAAQLAQRGKR